MEAGRRGAREVVDVVDTRRAEGPAEMRLDPDRVPRRMEDAAGKSVTRAGSEGRKANAPDCHMVSAARDAMV